MSIPYKIAKQPEYVAVIGESVNSASRLMRLGTLIEGTTETNLNRHIIDTHIPSGAIMNGLGFQYDAELAAFLGISLQETADVTLALLEAIRTGKSLGATEEFYRKFKKGLFDDSSASVSTYLDQAHDYTNRLKAELKTLYRLGVASGDQFDTFVKPVEADPFFREFSIEIV